MKLTHYPQRFRRNAFTPDFRWTRQNALGTILPETFRFPFIPRSSSFRKIGPCFGFLTSPDPQKLQDAEKRVKEATEKEHAAFQKVIAANNGVDQTFKDGLDKADPALQSKLKQAEEDLEKAKEERAKAAATQEATPSTENENAVINAGIDESNAWSAADAARKEVIDGFDEETKKAYDEAVGDYEKASKEWIPTENEKRAAYHALEKLQQAAASN